MDSVHEGKTINWVYYKVVLLTFHELMIRQWPEMWKNVSWIFHQDNMMAHNVSEEDISGEAPYLGLYL